jgi:hypothetical protein
MFICADRLTINHISQNLEINKPTVHSLCHPEERGILVLKFSKKGNQ